MDVFSVCNIVNSPCKSCGEDLPLHLGDYNTDPAEIECYCENHLPDHDCRIFILKEESSGYPVGWKMGIRALTDNARNYKEDNYPNLCADMHVCDI